MLSAALVIEDPKAILKRVLDLWPAKGPRPVAVVAHPGSALLLDAAVQAVGLNLLADISITPGGFLVLSVGELLDLSETRTVWEPQRTFLGNSVVGWSRPEAPLAPPTRQ